MKCLANRAITVSSSHEKRDAALRNIVKVMKGNGYPRHWTRKIIRSQLRRQALPSPKLEEKRNMQIARIPYVEGLGHEIRRIARLVGVNCVFYTPQTLGSLYHAKDSLPRNVTTHAVYSVKCKTCSGEYVGETSRAIKVRTKEHQDAIRLGQGVRSAIALHIHDQPSHEMDWSSLRVIDRARFQNERRIREALHIRRRNPQLNRDSGMNYSEMWKAVV